MEVLTLPDFQGSQRLKITLEAYSWNLRQETSPTSLHSQDAAMQEAAVDSEMKTSTTHTF